MASRWVERAMQPFFLPIEIWDQCFFRCSSDDLKSLSLVCQSFRPICQRYLYRSLSYRSPELEMVGTHNVFDLILEMWKQSHFHSTLALDQAGQSVLPYVHEWTWAGVLPEYTSRIPVNQYTLFLEAYNAVLRAFLISLPKFPALTSLSLRSIEVNRDARTTLAMLPRLDDLALSDCNISAPRGPLLRLRTCEVTYHSTIDNLPNTTRDIELVDPARLEALTACRSAGHPDVVLPWLVRSPALPQRFERLTSLTAGVRATSADVFFAFLHKCPHLRRLALSRDSIIPAVLFPAHLDPDTVVPRLREVFVPLNVAYALVPGRPVERVNIHHRAGEFHDLGSIVEALRAFGRAAVPLRHLSVTVRGLEPSLDVFGVLRETHPRLRVLKIDFDDRPVPATEDDADADSDEEETGSEAGRRVCIDHASFTAAVGAQPRDPRTFAGMIDALLQSPRSLPPALEELALGQLLPDSEHEDVQRFSLVDQRRAVACLARQHAGLQSVSLGLYGPEWVRMESRVWMQAP
ncbi:hypothetical protein CONPUDRAFT_148087 [Coniophora puteana RWD-64-598 SS2]|uniref:F-box domain-containing protein n=1 Tax=Coniophora puteana (strain RWD-64-598) TaxID=741705 RepID=A0A5M3N3N3_CONPW|nr:uncharacterized protein CONPUDRAFT_148087 [Coniophora puteana RWD-64-598 SS2]EIW85956.1 hypothetical protein CONPUDRAFT_148087 [Coniophora puteana RWD-64-598 SS2]